MQTCVQHAIRENHGNIQHPLDIVLHLSAPPNVVQQVPTRGRYELFATYIRSLCHYSKTNFENVQICQLNCHPSHRNFAIY